MSILQYTAERNRLRVGVFTGPPSTEVAQIENGQVSGQHGIRSGCPPLTVIQQLNAYLWAFLPRNTLQIHLIRLAVE